MHIPDGYLSPSTCAVMTAVSLPFWATGLKRVKAAFNARLAPLISVCAAFSFVVMMFNLPLPGGTTGHAVGVAVAAIVLGPWASMLAISVALLIQAVFFGDGGITAFGANCFNMAITGSFVADAVYRAIAGAAPLGSRRRVIAAGLAGYVALNAAALLAGIEFGLQPLLFHDASGAPLYCPYPLGIAVPAMMLGHLAFAGVAEGILAAGVVAWLQQNEPSLFELQAPTGRSRAQRVAWAGIVALVFAAPLGLIASGTAWGEWGVEDFQKPETRAAVAAASGNVEPPAEAPRGLARLAGLWSAPLPDYAPSFLHNAAAGYILSAGAGVALTGAAALGLQWLARGARRRNPAR
jgi:cobalt/nickel transport system permease protein